MSGIAGIHSAEQRDGMRSFKLGKRRSQSTGGHGRTRKVVVLLDGTTGGHHLAHMIAFSALALKIGYEVLSLSPEPIAVQRGLAETPQSSAVSRLHCARFTHAPIVPMIWKLRRYLVPLQRWRSAWHAIRSHLTRLGLRPDIVYLGYLDDYLDYGSFAVRWLLPLVFPCKWTGLFFFPVHLRLGVTGHEASVSREHFLRATNCSGVALLDEGVVEALAKRIGRRVVAMPEIGDMRLPEVEPAIAKKIRERARGRPILGIVGALQRRKGVLRALELGCHGSAGDFFIVIAGAFDSQIQATYTGEEVEQVKAAAAANMDNFFFHLEFIQEETDLNAVVNVCDVLYAVYDEFPHSSGLVAKAAAFEKRILVRGGSCMAERVERFKMGIAVSDDSLASLRSAIECALDADAFLKKVGISNFEGYRDSFAEEKLASAFGQVLSS